MYLISYDISSDRLRNRVSKLLEGYGRRVQYSVFECSITEKQYKKLREELSLLMTGNKDAGIRIYRLCRNCEDHIYTIGESGHEPPSYDEDLFII